MRRKIEGSIGCALGPVELEEIERHCAECDSCRAYRELLLADHLQLTAFAAPREESVRRVREGAIERVLAMERVQGRRRNRMVAPLPRFAAIAAAAASVIIAFVVIDLIRGAHNGPVPAFADVVEKIQECDNVIYRNRRWNVGEWTTCVRGWTSSGVRREEQGDSITLSHSIFRVVSDQELEIGEKILKLYPLEKRAVISGTSYLCSKFGNADSFAAALQKKNVLVGFAALHKAKTYAYVRTERCEGKNTAVYERNSGKPGRASAFTIWVDLKTQLPVRMEVFSSRRFGLDYSCPYGLRWSDFAPKGSKAAGWIDLEPNEPYEIYDDFRWSAAVDTSYFSSVPPPGYSVENRRKVVDRREPEGDRLSRNIAPMLSTWLSLSGNVFPDDLHSLADSTKVKPLLLARFRRGENPAKEFRAAYDAALELQRETYILFYLDTYPIPLVYSGKGAVFGDSSRVICRIQLKGEPCYTIYGDLHIAESPTPPKSAGE